MTLIGVRVNISGGVGGVCLAKALSYLTGSHVPQGASFNLVGIDYDSPHNAADVLGQTMYVSYYPTTDKLVDAWRNGFAAHCNARDDLNLMSNLGEFIVGWNTATIDYAGTGPTGGHYEEEVFYNFAPLDTVASRSYVVATAGGSRPTIVAEAAYFCHTGMDEYDGIIVGDFNGNQWLSKFALGGDTQTNAGNKTAKISLIDAYNKSNPPFTDQTMDFMGNTTDNLVKYGYARLQDIPMTIKIQPSVATHFTIPMGGVKVMCGYLRLTDNWNDITQGSGTGANETGADSANSGTVTFWIDGWDEF